MRHSSARRLSARLAVSVLTVAALAGPASAAAAPCAGGGSAPSTLGSAGTRQAVLCLVNRQRGARGLRGLRHDRRLGRAAEGHSRDMVAHRYFAHDSRSGASAAERVARTGWMRGRRSWSLGENLAWGVGPQATPEAIVAEWMQSPDHRRNILDGRFRVIGIGVADGAPVGPEAAGATYTTDFAC